MKSGPTAGTKRSRASARAAEEQRESTTDEPLDLLTAALIGLAIGAGATLMLRRGPGGRRPIAPVMRAMGHGAKWAGEHGLEGAKWAGARGARGARWAADRGEELWDRVPREEIAEKMHDYVETARDAIDEVVASELNDLRKSIRRQRKRIGI